MPSPTEDHCFLSPSFAISAQLEIALRYEQAGLAPRALAAYRAAFEASGDTAERAGILLRVARVHRTANAWEDTLRESREALRLAEHAGADDIAAEAMNVEVGVHLLRGDFRAGEELARRALVRAISPRVRGMLLQNLGVIAARERDFAAADRFFSDSVDAFRAANYDLGLAIALNNASAAARDAGSADRALAFAHEATELGRRIDAIDVVVLAVENQAHALMLLGRYDEAEMALGESLGHFAVTGNALRQAECLEIMGALHESRNENREYALRCYRRATDLAQSVGDRVLVERLAAHMARLGVALAPV